MKRFAEQELGVEFKFDALLESTHRLFAKPAGRAPLPGTGGAAGF